MGMGWVGSWVHKFTWQWVGLGWVDGNRPTDNSWLVTKKIKGKSRAARGRSLRREIFDVDGPKLLLHNDPIIKKIRTYYTTPYLLSLSVFKRQLKR